MINKIVLTGVALGALLLTGCGDDEDSISNKKYVAIIKYAPSGICESQEYRDRLSERYINIVTKETSNNVDCADYGKRNDGVECDIGYYTGYYSGNVACVVGTDGRRYNKQAKITGESTFSNDIDTMLIQIAE